MVLASVVTSVPAIAETKLRIATFNAELLRDGPGLLLRDILSATDPQVEAIARIIAKNKPDIIALQGVDYDHDLKTLGALRARIEEHGHHLPFMFAARPNTGMVTGLDLDGDGKLGGPRDAQGYGEFAGQGGMGILSGYPILRDEARDFSELLWKDIPDALLRLEDGKALLSPEVSEVQRLSTVAHWSVPIIVENRKFQFLTFHASPPVFDGPEDRNGRRNHDEIVFWIQYLDGAFGTPPGRDFILLGDANLDPADGDGRKDAITRLLSDPRLTDPKPKRNDSPPQGSGQTADPRLDTVDWPGPDPGSLRVSYILPSSDLIVLESGIVSDADHEDVTSASRHMLVWTDLLLK